MSLISTLLDNNNIITVSAQTDEKYKNISSNQCSWCAWEFAVNAIKLIHFYNSKNKTEFINLYNLCLLNGSNKRVNGNKIYGENIDTPELINSYSSYNLMPLFSYTYKINNNDDFLKILHKDLKEEFYSREHVQINNYDNFINDIHQGTGLLVSRHGQSLFVVKVDTNKNLVLDSHVHEIGYMNDYNLKTYILNNNGGHTHLTIIKINIF